MPFSHPGRIELVTLLISALAILAVNPLTIGFGVTSSDFVPHLRWVALAFDLYLALLVLLFLVFRKRRNSRNLIINQFVLLGSALLIALTLRIADVVLGMVRHNWDLIFMPNTSAHYVTPEFDYTADINAFGIRGPRNAKLPETGSFIILMVGDSFTFGWGLKYEDTWPARVETRLREQGLSVRVFNLGKPGGSPIQYGQIAERASKLLKPDLIVVNLLQGDDLFQLVPSRSAGVVYQVQPSGTSAVWRKVQECFRQILPNLSASLFGSGVFGNPPIEADVASDWRKQAEMIYQQLSAEQQQRFVTLDDTIKSMFSDGQLNPKLVLDGLLTPNRFMFYEDMDAYGTQFAVRALTKKLIEMHEIGKKNNCAVWVNMIPYSPYVSEASYPIWRGMGYDIEARLLKSASSEEVIREAAVEAGLDFFSPLEQFREAARHSQLYYKYDEHFNSLGAALYAQYVSELFESRYGQILHNEPPSGNE